jgi:hypothetical protein
MNWIDDRLEEQQAARKKSVLIEGAAENIYNQLWDELSRWVQEAADKGIAVFTNGEQLDRVIVLSPKRAGEAKRLSVRLQKDKHGIMVGGVRFDIDLCADNVVCPQAQWRESRNWQDRHRNTRRFPLPQVRRGWFVASQNGSFSNGIWRATTSRFSICCMKV